MAKKPQKKKLWMKRSRIACDRLTPHCHAFVHRVFRFSSRKSLFFAKLFNALSLFLRHLATTLIFPPPFLIFFENRSKLESGCLSRILKLLIQLVFSISFDRRRQNFFTFHDGFSIQVLRYIWTTYLSLSLFQVYMYVFLPFH